MSLVTDGMRPTTFWI